MVRSLESLLAPATTMSPTRAVDRSMGSISPPSGPNLSNRMVTVWHRSKAKVNRLLANVLPNTHITRTCESTCRFPYEIVEMIIAHLIDDLNTLKACSLTCRSWYTVAASHIHHTLVLCDCLQCIPSCELRPLSKLHELGLIPLVKEIRVRQWRNWFAPQTFNPRDLRHFSAFANVQTLDLRDLAIYLFIPDSKHYFGHFSPTLRSITLVNPVCSSPQQLSYFLSLFPNLDNIDIWGSSVCDAPTPDAELIPPSTPKLRGRLMLQRFCWVETWTCLIPYGGLRFRYMDLGMIGDCAPILLEACADTLETLRFYAPNGLEVQPFSFPKLDLSGLKVLRSLELGIFLSEFRVAGILRTTAMRVFATITSPVFSELVVVIGDDYIARIPSDVTLVEALRAMNEVRPFKLVFLLVVPNRLRGEGRRKLVEALDSLTARGSLDFLDSPPTVRVTWFSGQGLETRRL